MQHELVHERTLAFGQSFSDHMVVARYREDGGWSAAEVVPFDNLVMSPAAMVFHYGQSIFEGLKAFRQPDGGVALFRPADNARRFQRSAERLAMPSIPADLFVDACLDLVGTVLESVPSAPGESLYLRPMMIATEEGLGVRPATEYLFAVIGSPAGAYFGAGLQPITVWVDGDTVRAAPGGTGFAKCAGNYGASLVAKRQAVAHGCDETLWLDAHERRWIEEMGGMNIAFVEAPGGRPTLVTPPIGDTILDGVTRRSLLELALLLGYDVVERHVAIDELREAGSYEEAFACGTAAVIVPIGGVRSPSDEITIGDGNPGPVTVRLREALVAIQEGRAADPFGWRVPVTR